MGIYYQILREICMSVVDSLVNYWSISWNIFLLQYYEMSYGLNVEMHKQVSLKLHFTSISDFRCRERTRFPMYDFIFILLLFGLFLHIKAVLLSKCCGIFAFCFHAFLYIFITFYSDVS